MLNFLGSQRDRHITREIHRLFWRANTKEPWPVFICFLFRIPALTIVHAIIPLNIAYGLEAIVDKRFEDVRHYAIIIIALTLVHALCWAVSGVFITKHGSRAGAYLQRLVFANYLNKDYDFYSNTYFGSLGAQALRLREAFNNEYNILIFLAIPKQLVIVLGGVIVIGIQSTALAAVTLLMMTVVLSFTIFSGTWRLKYRRLVSEASSEVSGKIGDALTHATTVKSFAAEKYEETRLHRTLEKWQRLQYISWALSIPADIGRMILSSLAMAVLLLMTANLYQTGDISIAIVALVQLYVVKMIHATVELSEIIKAYEQAMGGAYQPVQTMLIEAEVKDPLKPRKLLVARQHAIRFEGVSFRYPGTKASASAVKKFTLSIQPGEKVGLVGYSGSGKTTLTKLLSRYMDVSSGVIKIDNLDIRTVTQDELRQHIAYVPQEPLLFHRSILENIAYGDPLAKQEKIMSAARMAYVDEFVDDLPEGYETFVGERGVKLSGGQRQRVAIARAILKDAPILVLDEATSALDSKSEQLIQQALWQLMKDRTALVIAHRLSTIQRMDRIVVMDKGRVVQAGTHAELLKDRDGIYAELWSHQSGGYIGVRKEEVQD